MDTLAEIIEKFYRVARLSVEAVENREIGCESVERGFTRHEHVATLAALRRYAQSHRCAHLYHSVAYYRSPWARDFAYKAMFDSDLVIDIDLKRGVDCADYRQCLSEAMREATQVLDALRGELGLDAYMTFSGSKGFHIRVPRVGMLDDEDRRALLRYLTEPRQISHAAIGTELVDLSRYSRDAPAKHLDTQVLMDAHRLIRVEGSIHGKTGLVAVRVNPNWDIDRVLRRASWVRDTELRARIGEPCDSPWGELRGEVHGQQALYAKLACR